MKKRTDRITKPCDCKDQTERYDCPKSFGHAHCPRHCLFCFPDVTETYKPTQPDDLLVCLDLMDKQWGGFQTAKKIIRDHVERLRFENGLVHKQNESLQKTIWEQGTRLDRADKVIDAAMLWDDSYEFPPLTDAIKDYRRTL